MTANLAEKIQDELRRLPEPLIQEVLDFIGYLAYRHGLRADDGSEALMLAQRESMLHVWDNPEDEIWNHVSTR
ncbi:MAG: DUF2281 domain-containing protein [Magnetococcales bacterium]|nr:DUF2281 domain-containing protein [Magnetococcales bacterium]